MCVMSVMLRSFWALPLVKISICVTRNAAFGNLLTCFKISLTKALEMIAVFLSQPGFVSSLFVCFIPGCL